MRVRGQVHPIVRNCPARFLEPQQKEVVEFQILVATAHYRASGGVVVKALRY